MFQPRRIIGDIYRKSSGLVRFQDIKENPQNQRETVKIADNLGYFYYSRIILAAIFTINARLITKTSNIV
jgi:hypothetical protein